LVKGLIWTIALASGTSGGVLAPLLIMGAGLGVVEAGFIPGGGASLWPLVSMAAVMGGMMRSPFTAVMFALELTNSVNSLPALLIASICSYAFTVLVMKRSILTEKIARRGHDIFREYGVDPLDRMTVAEAMTKDIQTIHVAMTTKELAGRFFGAVQRHRGYPVVDDAGRLVGMIAGSDLRRVAGSCDNDSLTAAAVMAIPPLVALPDEPCKAAAERMATAGVGRLPVVARDDRTMLLGILTRSDLLKSRNRYVEEEVRAERILRVFASSKK
jgi:CBS domain-containing protein